MTGLGDFLHDLIDKVEHGSPPDACVLCGTKTRLMHPVGRAWACFHCHTPTPAPMEDR